MKLNNKGFAISTVMYLILILGVILITSTLLILSSRKLVLDKQKSEVLNSIYKICTPVTNTTKTTGFIPTGGFYIGDEYICEVKPGARYNFFVLNTIGDNVILIMDSNVNEYGDPIKDTNDIDKGYVSWISDTDYGCGVDGDKCAQNDKGPVSAIEYLNLATSTWNNIPNLDETYSDSNGRFTNFELSGKARLPKYSEVRSLCTSSCPLWVVNYLYNDTSYNYDGRSPISELYGYWLFDSYNLNSTTNNAWIISYSGITISANEGVYNNRNYGVRPVIVLSKDYFLK